MPDAAYQAALAFDPAERVRLMTVTFVAAEATLSKSSASLSMKLQRDAEESAVFYAQLTDTEKLPRCKTIEEGSATEEAGRVMSADDMFYRIRARHCVDAGTGVE